MPSRAQPGDRELGFACSLACVRGTRRCWTPPPHLATTPTPTRRRPQLEPCLPACPCLSLVVASRSVDTSHAAQDKWPAARRGAGDDVGFKSQRDTRLWDAAWAVVVGGACSDRAFAARHSEAAGIIRLRGYLDDGRRPVPAPMARAHGTSVAARHAPHPIDR